MKGQRAENIRVSSEAGDDSPMSNLLLSLLGAVVESLIKERQREGIAVSKKTGPTRAANACWTQARTRL